MNKFSSFYKMFYSPIFQVPQGTNRFFEWYFYGLGGIGGWVLFFLLALAATIWLFYDSLKRRLPATGWKIGVVLLTLLVLPTILYRFTVTPIHYGVYQILQLYPEDCPFDVISQTYPEITFTDCNQLSRSLPPLTPYGEVVFYLGLLGGLLAPVVAIGYFVTFQGLVGCSQGHIYEKALEKVPGQCPKCAEIERRKRPPEPAIAGRVPAQPIPQPAPVERPKTKPVLQYAWLVDITNNRRYDLCQGTTLIGRSAENDIMLPDQSVSGRHAQIREANGHFTLSDIGSSYGTLLNGKKLRNPLVLQNGDEITLGDTVLKFVSSQ